MRSAAGGDEVNGAAACGGMGVQKGWRHPGHVGSALGGTLCPLKACNSSESPLAASAMPYTKMRGFAAASQHMYIC